MKLKSYCKSCSKANTINSKSILLRRDLEEKYGEKISYQCKECLQNNTVHPNQVYATSSKLPLLICSIIGLVFIVGGVIIKNSIGYSSIYAFGIGGTILTAGFLTTGGTNAKAFNRSRI